MQNGITLITPTGDRYETFMFCEMWMARQSVKPNQWIVIDDGITRDTRCTLGQDYKKRVRLAGEPPHTLHLNLLVALPLIKYNKILIIEDDDYYAANYIEKMNDWLAHSHMVGQGEAIYYNIQNQTYRQMHNRNHASLCQTGFTSINIERLRTACELTGRGNSTGIDILFWRNAVGKKYLEFAEKKMLIGLKGLPGRRGFGCGHSFLPVQDVEFQKLRELLGDDAQVYIDMLHLPMYQTTQVSKEIASVLKMKGIKRTADGGVILIRQNKQAEAILNRLCKPVEKNKWILHRNSFCESEFMKTQKDVYKDKTCYIVAKGPSLDKIPFSQSLFKSDCPIIALNESIHKVEGHYKNKDNVQQITNPLYCVQQDTILGETCYSKYGTMILPFYCKWYHNHPKVLTVIHSELVVKDKRFPLSIETAILVAKHWGCSDIVFMACDAAVNGNCDYANSIGHEPRGDRTRYLEHIPLINRTLDGMKHEYQYPSKSQNKGY